MVQTAVIVAGTIYQAVVTVKSIGMLMNQKRAITAAGYKSMAQAQSSFSNLSDTQAVNEGITDTTTFSGQRRTWRASETRLAENYQISNGYGYNKSYKVVNGTLTEVPHGTTGSQRPDFYNPTTNHIVEVKNYTITTSTGRNNLANNIASQYHARRSMFPGATVDFKVDIYGQSYTQEMLNDVRNRVANMLGNYNMLEFITE